MAQPPAYNPEWNKDGGGRPPYPGAGHNYGGQPASYPGGFGAQPPHPGQYGGQPPYPGGPSYNQGQQGYGGPPPVIGMPPPPMHLPARPDGGYGSGVGADAEVGGSRPKNNTAMEFSDASLRRAFIRKVYIILTCMLLVVVAMISACVFVNDVKWYVQRNTWVYWVSYATFVVVYIALVCCESVRRNFPVNFVMLGILTICIGYMTAMISSMYDTKIVFVGMAITAGVCLSISLFAINTKYDFTSWIGVMFAISMVMLFFGIFAIIFRNKIMYAVYGGIMALVFMVYLAIDTQMLVGGKKHELSPEDYIFAAIQLFLDVIYIFWFILQLLGMVSKS